MGDAEMSQDVVKNYLVDNGGVIRNVDLVRHFRKFLQPDDVASKERNREKFKNFVNTLAAVKSEGGEKFIILKPKFYPLEWGGALPGSLPKATLSASGRHGSSPDMSDYRAPSPTRPLRQTVHIPGVVVPAVDSDNESDCVSSLSAFSLDSNMTAGYARKATNTTIKLLQNGGKAVRASRPVDDRLGPRGAPPALLPGAGLIMPPKMDAPSSSMSGQSTDGRDDETSSTSTASFSAFDYEMMDPLEHEWIMSAVQSSHETSQRLVETEPNLINKRAFISGYTALHWAAMNGNDVMLSTLLLNGADVNAKSTMGLTPLHMAAQRGYDNIIQLLITHYGALTDIRDNSGKLPRDVAKKTVSSRSRDLLEIGLAPSERPRKRKNAMLLNRKKSRSFSGSLPTIHLQPDEDFGGDDSMDGGGVRRFFRSPLLSIRRSVRRKESLTRSRSGTVYN